MNAPDDPRPDGAQGFEQEARRLLRRGAEEIDAATASRLNRARQAALAEFDRRAQSRLPGGWQPALGAAAVATLALALWLGREPVPPAAGEDAAVELELMLADENLEMLEELEFYDWLQAADAQGDLDPGRSG